MHAFVSVIVALTAVLLDVAQSSPRDVKPRAVMRRVTGLTDLRFSTPAPAAFAAEAA